MFYLYRKLEPGEFILAGGDCAQGGADSNVCQFLSKTKLDIPLVYDRLGVAAQMTPDIFSALEQIHDITGVKPVVGLERNMGGASEMERFKVLNRNNKYDLFVMPITGDASEEEKEGTKLGYVTSEQTRPTLVGDLKNIIDVNGVHIYHKRTVDELFWFIINNQGKPEAMRGKFDNHVMSLGVVWQMFQTCVQPLSSQQYNRVIASFPKDERFKGGVY